jgi:ribose transport system permease protein
MSAKTIRKLITLGLVIVLMLVFGFTTESFFTVRNFSMLFRNAAYVGLIGLGVSFVMIGGGIDLSAGGIICFVGIVCARLGVIKGFPAILIILIAILAGALCGFINGLCVTKLHLSEFITTLSSGYIFSGLAVFLVFRESNGVVSSQPITNKAFLALGGAAGKYFYYIAIAWVALAVIVLFVQTRTKFGVHLVAMGSNAKSASMSGVDIVALKIASFVLCGVFCALGAIFTVAYQGSSTLTLGGSMGFQAVAACVVGGIVLGGGRGDAVGAFLGALFMTLLLNGIYKYGLSTAWQYMAQGIFILIAIFFDAGFARVAEHRRMKRAAAQTPAALANAAAAAATAAASKVEGGHSDD